MELFIKANRVSRYNLRMLYENIRIPIAIFVAMIYVMESLTNIASFSSIVNVTTLIISKKPGNTGISRDIRTEFTTDLLLSD